MGCNDSLNSLLSLVNGVHNELECDLVDILYTGAPAEGEMAGAFRVLGQRYAYLMTLISEAYVVVVTYQDLAGETDKDQEVLGMAVQYAASRFQVYLDKCLQADEMRKNTIANLDFVIG